MVDRTKDVSFEITIHFFNRKNVPGKLDIYLQNMVLGFGIGKYWVSFMASNKKSIEAGKLNTAIQV